MLPFTAVVRRRESRDARPNVVAVVFLLVPALLGVAGTVLTSSPAPAVAGVILGLVLMQSPKIAQQWERAIVLRLGRFRAMRGPGLFFIVPFIDASPRGSISARSRPPSPRSRRSRRIRYR